MYQYEHFKPKYYDFSKFEGPKPGENAVDFEAIRLNGEKVRLSEFFGNWIVIETGSITCPIYESKIEPMNHLAKKFSDVTFLVLYVREAHPGEKIGQHKKIEDKIVCAKRARSEDKENRTILIDDIEGTVHKTYGNMPNSVYIINPEGKIVFRGDWNSVREVKRILNQQDPEKIYTRERFSARPDFSGNKRKIFGALQRAGRQSVWDFVVALPVMITKHIRKLF